MLIRPFLISRRSGFILVGGVVLAGVAFSQRAGIADAGVALGFFPESWRVADRVQAEGGFPGNPTEANGRSRVPGGAGKGAGRSSGVKRDAGLNGVPALRGAEERTDGRQGKEKEKSMSGDQITAWAGRIVGLKGSREFEGELDLFLTNITRDNWREAAEAVKPLYDFLHHDKWGEVMRQLGAAGGREAVEFFKPENTLVDYEGYGSRNAMKAWAAADRKEALAFLQSLPEGRYRDGMGIGFLRGISDGSVTALDALYDQLPKDLWPQIAAAQRDMIRWEPPGPEAAISDWLNRTEADFGHDSERFRVARETADLNFLEGAMWSKDGKTVAALTNEFFMRPAAEVTNRVLNTALANLGNSDPAVAMSLAESHYSSRTALLTSVPMIIRAWSAQDLGAPGDWLNANQDSRLYPSAVTTYAQELQKQDPAAAAAWRATLRPKVTKPAVPAAK